MTFSAKRKIDKSFLDKVTDAIEESGFRLNRAKSRFLGRGDRIEVTGFVINEKVRLPREWRYRIRAMLHQAELNPAEFGRRVDELIGIQGALKMWSGDVDDCRST